MSIKYKLQQRVRQFYLNMGGYFLRKGVGLVVGQQIQLPRAVDKGFRGGRVKRGVSTVWVDNIYFNFKLNKITYTWSDKPVPVVKADEAKG